jgi:DNA-binding transcriptional regulator YbjK|tara:strand:+ start:116 stop:412 length:297 start_codon:yes stop_codon:yes gene_type:complete
LKNIVFGVGYTLAKNLGDRMKKKRQKPTIKEVYADVGTLFRVVSSMGSTVDSMRILLEHYLEMKKDTDKLAKFIENKAEELKNVNQRSEEESKENKPT